MHYMGSQAAPRLSQSGVADGVILIGLIVFGLIWSTHDAETEGAQTFLCVGVCSGASSDHSDTKDQPNQQGQPVELLLEGADGQKINYKSHHNKFSQDDPTDENQEI